MSHSESNWYIFLAIRLSVVEFSTPMILTTIHILFDRLQWFVMFLDQPVYSQLLEASRPALQRCPSIDCSAFIDYRCFWSVLYLLSCVLPSL